MKESVCWMQILTWVSSRKLLMWSRSQGLLFKMQKTKAKNAEALCFCMQPVCSPTMCSHAPGETYTMICLLNSLCVDRVENRAPMANFWCFLANATSTMLWAQAPLEHITKAILLLSSFVCLVHCVWPWSGLCFLCSVWSMQSTVK